MLWFDIDMNRDRHPEETDELTPENPSRRRFLGGVATTVALASVGCAGGPPGRTDHLGEAAVPVDRTAPPGDPADIQSLPEALGDAAIVGLGEATYGTREFFQLKHRILRSLVLEHGVRTVTFENGFARTRALDDYVRRGEGDARTALSTSLHPVWQAEAVLATVDWLRSFNAGRPAGDRVSLYGLDATSIMWPARELRSYLRSATPPLPGESARSELNSLAEAPVSGREDGQLQRALATAGSVADALESHLADHESAYVDATSRGEYERALRDIWTIRRARPYIRARHLGGGHLQSHSLRDESMAENVAWVRDHEDADTVVVWAHNGHVKNGEFGDPVDGRGTVPVMGRHLTEQYGDEGYYALAMDFASGSFRARNTQTGRLDTFTVDSPDGTRPFSATMAGADPAVFLLDFASVSEPELRESLNGLHDLYTAGLQVDPASVEERATQVDLTEAYDGVAFVEEASAARMVHRST
jgi:erythromycin esterase